jgi:hypothetical protein
LDFGATLKIPNRDGFYFFWILALTLKIPNREGFDFYFGASLNM